MRPYIPLRERVPHLHAGTVMLRNRLYSSPPAAIGGGRTLIWQNSGHFAAAGALRCSLGDARMDLAMDQLSLLTPELQGLEWSVPAPACTALVEHAMAPLLEWLEHLTGATITCEEFLREGPQLRDVSEENGASALRIGFVLLGAKQQREVRGWVQATADFWRSLDLSRVTAIASTRIHNIALDLSVQVGGCRLLLSEVRQLEVGDALRASPRLARRRDGLPVQVAHVNGGFGGRALQSNDQLILETTMRSTSSSATPQPTIEPVRTGGESQLSDIECDMTFEIGRLRISLGEIARLRVGQTLHAGTRLQDQPVHVLVGGRQIARGELAALGDELVIVLTETCGLPDL